MHVFVINQLLKVYNFLDKVMNKTLVLSLCLLLNCNVFGADLPTKLDPLDNNYALSIQMPATSAKLSTHEFNIPFSHI